MKRPLIIDIKGHSLDDGPGIRSVVFIKGCPLRCSWCQNPESQRTTAELSWDREKCIKCGACAQICPEQAISGNNPFFIDRKACSLCFACVETCPAGALRQVGKAMTVDEIVANVLRYRSFFDTSGGGVTLSGGEPTMYMDFSAALLRRFKEEGLHTLLETCGHFDRDRFENLIFPWIDTIYMDIKIADRKKHQGPLRHFQRFDIEKFCMALWASSRRKSEVSATNAIDTGDHGQRGANCGTYRSLHQTRDSKGLPAGETIRSGSINVTNSAFLPSRGLYPS